MTRKVVKSTSKGQITLPKQWRGNFDTDLFLVEMDGEKMVVTPFQLDEIAEEEVFFDSRRDNDGKGVPIDDMISILEDLQNG